MGVQARGLLTTTRATKWEESLISGNGRVGALVLGDPAEEVVTFSHEKLFLPTTPALPPIEMAPYLSQVRALLFAGRYQEAADLGVRLAEEAGYGGFRWPDPFVPAFDLRIAEAICGELRGYTRATDYETGEVRVTWRDDIGQWSRLLFVSRADDVAALKIGAGAPGKLACKVSISSTPGPDETDQGDRSFLSTIADVQSERDGLVLGWRAVFKHGHVRGVLGYQGAARVVADGGHVMPGPAQITVTGANYVLVLVRLEMLTDDRSPTLPDLAARLNLLDADYDKLLLSHSAIHGDLFSRSRLDLGGKAQASLPTEDLLERSRTGVTAPALLEKLFDAGRYAIVSSCGDLPPNLQGVWAGSYAPAWSGDYTHNGNVQTAMAGILSTGTPELLLSYFSFLESMLADFRHNSHFLFGCRGVYVPSRFSTHGLQNHFDEIWCHEFWTAGAGWAARIFCDYWQYTGDDDFLARRALPFMLEVADFYEDFLVEDEKGTLLFAPSLSPENNPGNSLSQATINATMDIAIAKDLFRNLIVACAALNTHLERIETWKALLARLPAYAVGADGALAEWAWPALHNNQAHRHASQLYPLLYEVDPELCSDKRLLQACRRAVQLRMQWRRQPGNGEMAFGIVWLGIVAAHLGMAEEALEALTMLATRYWRPSLVSTHDPLIPIRGETALFNVDICGGFPALVVEMLVQSSIGTIKVLPACPVEWTSGCIEGVACRGQIVLEQLRWTPEVLTATLRAGRESVVEVVLPQRPRALRIDANLVESGNQQTGERVLLRLMPGIPRTLEALIGT
jgi:alpha-L-fucosidase 2